MEREIKIPDGIEVKKQDDLLIVRKGNVTLQRMFAHPKIKVNVNGSIRISTSSKERKDGAIVGTWAAHIKNMINGLTKGYEYKLKIVYSHFPISVKVVSNEIHVGNFMGEKGLRKAQIVGDCKVDVQKEFITVSGPNKEDVGQTCANIEQSTRLTRFDKRRFSDGIYILQKAMKGE